MTAPRKIEARKLNKRLQSMPIEIIHYTTLICFRALAKATMTSRVTGSSLTSTADSVRGLFSPLGI